MKKFATIRTLFNSKTKQVTIENEFSGSIRIATNVLKNSSGTCHCGGMAIPMEVIGNTYKCVRCAEQSININYNLGPRKNQNALPILPKDEDQLINIDYYDDAIAVLKEEDKLMPRSIFSRKSNHK